MTVSNGGYTQGPDATLSVEIGGDPNSGKFGKVNAAGVATLGGTLYIVLTNGFGPIKGQRYQVMTFASQAGRFSGINGL